MSRWSALRLSKVSALLVVLIFLGQTVDSASAAGSQTPPLHFGGRVPALKNVLLTAGDIEAVPLAPPNVDVSKVNDASGLYQDPDPRLPCGRKASNPKVGLNHAVEEQVSLPEVLGFEAVVDLPRSRISYLLKQYESDDRVGCSFQSKTNTGSVQTSKLVRLLPMPHLVSHAVGLIEVITNNGHTFGVYEMVMIEGTRVAALSLLAAAPVHTSFVLALARVAEERLLGNIGA
jgi:hypothetical protein